MSKELLEKYTTYRDNVKWHIDTNKPEGQHLERNETMLKLYEEIVKDLFSLPSSGGMKWTFANEKKPDRQVCAKNIMNDKYGILSPWFDKKFFFVTTDFAEADGEDVTDMLIEYVWLDETQSPSTGTGEGWTTEKLKEVAADFYWENPDLERRAGYQTIRGRFDKWFAENKYYNPSPKSI